MNQIAENIQAISENIRNILKGCGRKDKVNLIAVTKTVGTNEIREAIEAGITDIGENKVQEVEKKYDIIGSKVQWHLIGSLQTNKVKYIIGKVALIHSLDRISLAEEINKRAKQKGIIQKCLVQINISKEDSKHGVEEEAVEDFIREVALRYSNIQVCGLMGMAPFELEKEATRPYFRKMKKIFDDIADQKMKNVSMQYLSMGMSGDYSIALEEGANMIRVGTLIFGERNYNQ